MLHLRVDKFYPVKRSIWLKASLFFWLITTACIVSVNFTACNSDNNQSKLEQYPDDYSITKKIYKALLKNNVTHKNEIKVETHKGVVQLTGFANSNNEIQRAVKLASETEGVRSVRNNIVDKK